jgi:hypothetical protein
MRLGMSITFDDACAALDRLLRGTARREMVDELSQAKTFGEALRRLLGGMRANAWTAGSAPISLDRIVKDYDRRTRAEGFHVLHDWDGVADKVNEDIIPVDVLHYLDDQRGAEPVDRGALAILLDYYFLHILALLSLRIWDDGDADAHLDRLNQLLAVLHGPDGGGQRFTADAETLILIATSHYELDERGYDTLLRRVRTLNQPHRVRIALGHAASLGCHLRFGFEATCGRDTVATRDDNVADYPWLSFSLATLMTEYARLHEDGVRGPEREVIVEAMLNGLTPDARAFVGEAPAALSACEGERAEFAARFHASKADLLDEFEHHRPTPQAYSPLSFFFNFSHNVLKGTIIDSLLWGEARHVTLNDMLSGISSADGQSAARLTLANTLMDYARANPHRIRGRLMPVIVYDPGAGRQAFSIAMRKLRE